MTNKFEQELLSLQWNRADSRLEPPETVVYVMTSDLTIHKAYRKGYSSSYNGMDYYDAHTSEKVGRVLCWAYC